MLEFYGHCKQASLLGTEKWGKAPEKLVLVSFERGSL
jgi:hypothetical protein